jgi:hypothetical protein
MLRAPINICGRHRSCGRVPRIAARRRDASRRHWFCGELFAALARIRDSRVSTLLVEQNARQGLNVADPVQRAYLGGLATSEGLG